MHYVRMNIEYILIHDWLNLYVLYTTRFFTLPATLELISILGPEYV
jgi:hypothetical protein